MNRISGIIEKIEQQDRLLLVSVSTSGERINALVFDTREQKQPFKPGAAVEMLIRDTAVVVGTEEAQLFLNNRFNGVISSLKTGIFLVHMKISTGFGVLSATIEKPADSELQFKEKTRVAVFIRANEIILLRK